MNPCLAGVVELILLALRKLEPPAKDDDLLAPYDLMAPTGLLSEIIALDRRQIL